MTQEKRFRFTKAAINALPVPEKRVRYRDEVVRGLTLSVMPTGLKVFYYYRKIDGQVQELKLGAYPDMSIEQARARAEAENVSVASGKSPRAERKKKREEWTLRQLFEWNVREHPKAQRKKTLDQDVWMFDQYLGPLAARKLSNVTKADLRQFQADLKRKHGPYTANKVMNLVRCLYGRAIAYDYFEKVNPAQGIPNFTEEKRDRRLTPEEMPRFMKALQEHPSEDLRDFVLLALYTGARRGNVLAMRWDQINFEKAEWRIPETKSGTPHTIQLFPIELEILRRRLAVTNGPWVFPGTGKHGHLVEPKKGWKTFLESAGIEGFRIHDLRRTNGSYLADTGAPLTHIAKILHHTHLDTTAGYARPDTNPLREAKAKALAAMLGDAQLAPEIAEKGAPYADSR